MATPYRRPQYEVRRHLAGLSGTTYYVNRYRSLPHARRKANGLTGNGQVGIVIDLDTGERVHTGTTQGVA